MDIGTGAINGIALVGADIIRPLTKRIGRGVLNGICLGFYHPTEKFKTFRYRHPSSVIFKKRFRSAAS